MLLGLDECDLILKLVGRMWQGGVVTGTVLDASEVGRKSPDVGLQSLLLLDESTRGVATLLAALKRENISIGSGLDS
ncbi:hypothetical protein TNCV_3232951 [Trichonephila clavipes]|nr:hypothetical protein TNCV_3232951 [Trichonephila clavipes]